MAYLGLSLHWDCQQALPRTDFQWGFDGWACPDNEQAMHAEWELFPGPKFRTAVFLLVRVFAEHPAYLRTEKSKYNIILYYSPPLKMHKTAIVVHQPLFCQALRSFVLTQTQTWQEGCLIRSWLMWRIELYLDNSLHNKLASFNSVSDIAFGLSKSGTLCESVHFKMWIQVGKGDIKSTFVALCKRLTALTTANYQHKQLPAWGLVSCLPDLPVNTCV